MSQVHVKQSESTSMKEKDQQETPTKHVNSPVTPPGDVVIELPPTDNRVHKYLRLSNGLECVLVSDPTCDKAAAAMDVGVGSMEDPVNLQGCAHFCEHLLFLGTEKYPEENGFSNYLSANNATYNAYTTLCRTNYYFDIAPEAFEEALDRFACFFTAPLFNAACTEREVNAVNAEQNKNLQNDAWRHIQLRRHLSSPGHPFRMFAVGSRETLWDAPKRDGRDPRGELIAWWKKTYCAKRMKLVVVAQENMDTLESWVRERFEAVPVRIMDGDGKLVYSQEVMEEERLGHFVFAEPVKDIRSLKMYFPFPDQGPLYASKPEAYLSHLIGHEGPGSLLSYLKRRGWASSLSAGCHMNAIGFDFFSIEADLSPAGLLHYKDVALTMYKYIELLRQTPPDERIFQELRTLRDIRFRCAERSRPAAYVSEVAKWMQRPTPREKVISSQWVVERFDSQEISSSVRLLDVKRSFAIVTAKSMPSEVGPLNQTEPVFGTRYRVDRMPEDFVKSALDGHLLSGLHMPGANAFVPANLKVNKKHVEKVLQKPVLLRDTSLSRLWHKKDDRFFVPRANVSVAFKSPLLDVTPRLAIISRLYCDLFRDSITEEVYDAKLAGLKYCLEHEAKSITVHVRGYNDKLPIFMEKMLKMMKEFKVCGERFAIVKEQLERECTNFELREPYLLLGHNSSYARSEHVTADDVQLFGRDFFARMYIETLVHGNMDDQAAVELQDMVEGVVMARSLTASEKVADRSLLLPSSSEHIWRLTVPDFDNVNSACEYYCQVGLVADDHLRPRLFLLARLAKAPVFDILRTKEQLGYVVFSSARTLAASMGFRILLQSEKPSEILEARVEAFLQHFKTILEEMSDDDFEMTKQGLISTYAENPKNLQEESSRYWNAIEDGDYDFERRYRDIAQIETITKKEIIELFMKSIHPSSMTRSKMSIHMDSQACTRKPARGDPPAKQSSKDGLAWGIQQDGSNNDWDADETPANEVPIRPSNHVIEDIADWKAGLVCGPAPHPVEKLVAGSQR